MSIKNCITICAISVLAPLSVFANAVCADVFNQKTNVKNQIKKVEDIATFNPLGNSDLEAQMDNNYSSPNIEAYRLYNQLKNAYPALAQSSMNFAIMDILKDESLSSFHDMLKEIFSELTQTQHENIMTSFKNKTNEKVSKIMSKFNADKRLKILDQRKITKTDMMRALGHMTFDESVDALIGSGGINRISSDSLVGRYLKAAKDAGYDVTTFVGEFQKGPGYQGRGGKKLYVSVDRNTGQFLEQVIGANPHLLMHNHTSGQGTLQMYHSAQSITYARYDYQSSLNSVWAGSIIPVIPLSSTEASQVKNYFTLGSFDYKYAKYPWGFKKRDEQTQEMQEYCRSGGYSSCTHWIGEMPLGDKLVDNYSVPGYVDAYSDATDTTRGLRTKAVGEFNVFNSNSSTESIGTESRTHRLARMVWLQGKGREQLWSVVGDKKAEGLDRGEWANPGWVLYNFLTRTTQQRVPVVFVVRNSATAPLDQAILDQMTSFISPY